MPEKKPDVRLVYTAEFSCDESLPLKKAENAVYIPPSAAKKGIRPVVAGFGPCGIFAALILAEAGLEPLVIERGEPVDDRVCSVKRFWEGGRLDTESNVQFGEGGAGTFSDGKLTTGIKDVRTGKVLEEFTEAGADSSIMYRQKPHIGTDMLRGIVKNLREKYGPWEERSCSTQGLRIYAQKPPKEKGGSCRLPSRQGAGERTACIWQEKKER